MEQYALMMLILSFFRIPTIIVHVEKNWAGSENVVEETQKYWSFQSYVMISSENAEQFFVDGRRVFAPAGDHELIINSDCVVVCGGYFSACYSNAIKNLAKNGNIRVFIIPMKCVL